ncbi:ABC transporter ATP-binding protein [Georgenia muralis]|uniref:Molybdate transport system ATP-binding protein n=1 Tax=Georgenia muralis TaxID=154117 RepID=A0A3N5A157_9MICO|nr:ATP-binding cassette domain-containing protein [Georgenia muralis]RPF27085.1 molybdate transport system ATP-binding protein [Georgenia muralis]
MNGARAGASAGDVRTAAGGEPAAVAVHAEVAARGLRLDVEARPGRVLGVLGPNGAGKSTLLALVAGLAAPSSGTVHVAGRLVAGPRTWVPPHDRRVTLLAQDPLLFPHLTALDNVAFGPRAAGTGRRDADRLALELLGQVGCADLAERRPAALSGGQSQRVALARALAPDPEVVLLDEPLSALDVGSAAEMRHLLRGVLRGSGRTAVLVTHDLLDVLAVADDVVVLDGGTVVEAGPVGEVLTRPRSRFAAELAGVNLVLGHLAADEDAVIAPAVNRGAEADKTSPPPLVVHGLVDAGCVPGEAVAATFGPRAVSVHRTPPGGSPRNAVPVRVGALERQGDLVRVRGTAATGHALAADITPASVTALDLAPGTEVLFSVKTAEVTIFQA